MEKRIEISVIVVTYNQEKTIGRTLDSILMQKIGHPYEIIIGDDCSTDNTENICRKYAERYPDKIRYFRRDHNLGVVRNYFQCIIDSRGKYLADCAGDDFWVDAGKLRKEYEVMEEYPGVSIIHTDWRCCDIDGGNVRISEDRKGRFDHISEIAGRGERNALPVISKKGGIVISEKGGMLRRILLHDSIAMIHLCTAMYRRDLIMSEMKSYPDLFCDPEYTGEDFQIMTSMAALGKVAYLPEVTLHYSVTPDSISHQTDFGKKFRQHKGNLILTERLRKHYGVSSDEISAYYIKELDYLSAQVFHSFDQSLLAEYSLLKRGMPLKEGLLLKTKIRDTIMKSRILWRLAHKFIGKRESI